MFIKLHHQRGITLLEQIFGLFLFSLLGTISLLSFDSLFKQNSNAKKSEELLETLNAYASLGRILNRDLKISFNQKLGNASISLDDNAYQEFFRLPTSLTLESATFGNIASEKNILTFYKSGAVTPGTIIISSNSKNSATCKITQALRGARSLQCQ
jgi:type II secretory pathway pseudopilin PulG